MYAITYICVKKKYYFKKEFAHDINSIMSPTKNIKGFGKKVAALRKEKGLTQLQLAEKMGITRRAVAYYETESDNPPSHIIVLLSEALNVSADELLGIKPTKNQNEEPNLALIRRMKRIEKLSPAKQKILLQTIDTFLKGADK